MPGLLPFSMAYWSLAASIMRQVSSVAVAWERLRARRKLGTAIAARSAMIATTIMISTRVKPERLDWILRVIGNGCWLVLMLVLDRWPMLGIVADGTSISSS